MTFPVYIGGNLLSSKVVEIKSVCWKLAAKLAQVHIRQVPPQTKEIY